LFGQGREAMAEVFGDRADFAIEAGVEPDLHTAATVWGHMCVWCRGVALGDINNRYCGLYHSYDACAWLTANLGGLWADELGGLDDIAAWNLLDGLLYGYHGDVEVPNDRRLEECRRNALQWGGFNFVTNWGEQFDGYKSFLVRPPGDSARVLSRRLPEQLGRGVSVSRRCFVDASAGFVRWFEGESRRLGVPCRRL
jgi:hypothetical protein